MRRTRQSDYRALTLSLSHRSFIGGDYDIAPDMRTTYSNMVRYIYDLKKKGPSCDTEGIAKYSDKSSSG